MTISDRGKQDINMQFNGLCYKFKSARSMFSLYNDMICPLEITPRSTSVYIYIYIYIRLGIAQYC